MFGPILRGNTINLEPPRPEVALLRQQWLADLDVTRLFGGPGVPSIAQSEEWYDRTAREESTILWAIVLEGATIGIATLHHIDPMHRQTRSGTLIGEREQWGNGYGTEVVRLRTAFALHTMGLERIETSSMAENTGMHRALERNGFRRIGVRTRCYFYDGEWQDEFMFELLRGEWLERQS
jgi:RimJ/RimL family protein N-acetyltransferase